MQGLSTVFASFAQFARERIREKLRVDFGRGTQACLAELSLSLLNLI